MIIMMDRLHPRLYSRTADQFGGANDRTSQRDYASRRSAGRLSEHCTGSAGQHDINAPGRRGKSDGCSISPAEYLGFNRARLAWVYDH
jgi:hypothetical protein